MKRVLMMLAFSLAAGFGFAESNGLKVSVGGGVDYRYYSDVQNFTDSGSDQTLRQTSGSGGVNAFVDISDYVTIYAGYRLGLGDYTFSADGASDVTYSNGVKSLAWGAELKFPLSMGDGFVVAPKIGFDDVIYLSGTFIGGTLNSDGKKAVSPMSVLMGADFDYAINDKWFVRFPVALGFAVNAKLSDAYYQAFDPYSYSSSTGITLDLGVNFGFNL